MLREREMQREVNMGLPLENRLHIDYCTEIIRLSFTQCMTSTVALWQSFHGKASRTKDGEKTEEQSYARFVFGFT